MIPTLSWKMCINNSKGFIYSYLLGEPDRSFAVLHQGFGQFLENVHYKTKIIRKFEIWHNQSKNNRNYQEIRNATITFKKNDFFERYI